MYSTFISVDALKRCCEEWVGENILVDLILDGWNFRKDSASDGEPLQEYTLLQGG